MRYLVDSDRVIEYLKGHRPRVSYLDRLAVDGLAISIITYGEVYEGIYYGVDPNAHEARFERFLEGVSVLGISRAVARRYARAAGDLRATGNLIPAPDLLIAATAIEHDLTLVTGNLRHFGRIPELRLLP